jgi:hypothetical protein
MSAYSDLVLAHPSLLAYWWLAELAGTTAVAAFGAIDGTYAGAGVTYGEPSIVPGDPTGTSVYFDHALPGDVRFGDNFDFSGTTPYSAEVWYKADVIEDDGYVWWKGTSGVGDAWLTSISTPVIVTRRVDSGGVNDGAFYTPGVAPGNLFHLVTTYGSNVLRLYSNGVEVNNVASTRSVATSTSALCLGSAFGGSGAKGWFQHASLYSDEMSPADVLAHYEAGNPPKFTYLYPRRRYVRR